MCRLGGWSGHARAIAPDHEDVWILVRLANTRQVSALAGFNAAAVEIGAPVLLASTQQGNRILL
jgi:hypothetical protein